MRISQYLNKFALSTLVIVPCLLLPPAFAKTVFASDIKSAPWSEVIDSLPEYQGTFNTGLRQSLRRQLNLPDINAAFNAQSEQADVLLQRVKELDADLSKYVRVSESISRFQQLKRLMPALKNIEERKLIEALLVKNQIKVPRLRNSRLLPHLDKRISILANSMIFNLKALVRENRTYEPQLLASMEKYGVPYSARIPDFILDYYLLPLGKNDQGKWLFDGSISLLGKYQMKVVSVESSISVEASSREQAEAKSMELLAESITEQLTQYLLTQS